MKGVRIFLPLKPPRAEVFTGPKVLVQAFLSFLECRPILLRESGIVFYVCYLFSGKHRGEVQKSIIRNEIFLAELPPIIGIFQFLRQSVDFTPANLPRSCLLDVWPDRIEKNSVACPGINLPSLEN